MTADTCATCGEPAYRQGLYGALTPPLCRDCADTETPEQTAALDSIAERLDGFEAEAKRLSAPTTESVDVATLTEAAHAEVARLCMEPRASWRMSIPANETRDSDLIISNALTASERALAAERSLVSDLAEKIRRRDAEATEMSRGYEDRIAAERSLREAAEATKNEAISELAAVIERLLSAEGERDDYEAAAKSYLASRDAVESRWTKMRQERDAARADLATAQAEVERLDGVIVDLMHSASAEATATREAVARVESVRCTGDDWPDKRWPDAERARYLDGWDACHKAVRRALDSAPSGEAT